MTPILSHGGGGPETLPYEDGDSLVVLKGGSVNVYVCVFVLRAPLTINSSAIESRGMGLSKMPGTSF